jgi:hypothetical protein
MKELPNVAYTTADEVLKRALIKWDSLNYQTSPAAPWSDENALKDWLTTTIIPEAESVVNGHCRRPDFLKHTDEVELFDGSGFRDFIVTSHRPMINITSLELLGVDGTWVAKSSSDYVMRGDAIRTRTLLPEGFQNIRLTYDWGYETVPKDVAHVVAELCAAYLQKRVAYKMGPLVRVGDYRIQLMNPEVFTTDLKDRLAHYVDPGALA